MPLELPDLRDVEVDGPIVYREWEGPAETTFVLVHGLGGSHVNWVRVAPELAGLGRVLALDLPGFGYSPLAGRAGGLMDQRRALDGFIEAVAPGRVVLCGNSMGGVLSVLEAAVEPGRVEGLVLTSSAFPWAKGALPHPFVLGGFALLDLPVLDEAIVSVRLRKVPPERLVRLGFKLITADPASIPPEVVRLHEEVAAHVRDAPGADAAFLEASQSLFRLGRRPHVSARALDAVACPVLVLHGRRDRFVPPTYAEAVLRRHPTWRGRIFPNVGHVPQLEAPGRWVSEVADWFSGILR